jgi:rubrerythrin
MDTGREMLYTVPFLARDMMQPDDNILDKVLHEDGKQYWFSAGEIAKAAADIELAGRRFYEKLERVADDPTVVKMCRFFAEQEQMHHDQFMEIAGACSADDSGATYAVNLRGALEISLKELTAFVHDDAPITDPPETVRGCLRIATQMEKISIEIYSRVREQFAARFAGVIDRILDNERGHLDMCRNVCKQLGIDLDWKL